MYIYTNQSSIYGNKYFYELINIPTLSWLHTWHCNFNL